MHLQDHQSIDGTITTTAATEDALDEWSNQFQEVFLTHHTFTVALSSAARLCFLVDQAMRHQIDHGFAMIRPPGHHASMQAAEGYCWVNHVAVATRYAQAYCKNIRHGKPKVFILDWDIHHGTGTQSIVWNDPDVTYFSIHRHARHFFPHHSDNQSGPEMTGVDGRNVNVAWTAPNAGDDDYYAVWKYLLIPMLKESSPDLVLISAGFDAAVGDMGQGQVSPECFGELTRWIKVALPIRTPIVCSLEGGYVLSVLQECVTEVIHALDEPQVDNFDSPVLVDNLEPAMQGSIRKTMECHRSYWKCLQT